MLPELRNLRRLLASMVLILVLLSTEPLAAEVTQEKAAKGYQVTFRLATSDWDDKPERVNLAGSFNGWNSSATAMTDEDGDGIWTATLPLEVGRYSYKFVIDGDRWITDPTDDAELREDDTYGGQNSGVIVGPDIRKAPPPEPDAINSDFLRHDPATDVTQVDNREVRIDARTLADDVKSATVVLPEGQVPQGSAFGAALVDMKRVDVVDGYDVWQAMVDTARNSRDGESLAYRIAFGDGKAAPQTLPPFEAPDADGRFPDALYVIPLTKFDVPTWAAHAVWYQIFPERFRNGDESNDPGRFEYENLVPWNGNWWDDQSGETPADERFDNFYTGTGDVWQRRYGGDLQGVREKLPYLRELGINAIYFNPVFEAESMHKYDTADFRHVDDNFGIRHEGDEYPPRFEGETEDPATWVWSPSDRVFLEFLDEAHDQGFKVVIDGVFNHVGRAHPFFQDVLENGQDSEYADWFEITDWGTGGEPGTPGGIQWVAWDQPNGHLPVFKKDPELGLAPGPREHIFNITRRWLDPDGDPATNDGIDGWRLDVPGDIPHPFWRDWRTLVKETKRDAYITGEIWPWADPWLQGDQFDAVMNYQFAMAAQDFFADQQTAIEPSAFNDRLIELTGRYPRPITYAQQNLVASHDTDRMASMFVNPDRPYDGANRPQDNATSFDGPPYSPEEPDETERARMRQLIYFQHTFVGAPMTYYGDEAGMWGPDDPSNRQPLPWPDQGPYRGSSNGFDEDVFETFQRAIAIRNTLPALRTGDFAPVLIDDGRDLYAFARRGDDQLVYILLNRKAGSTEVTLDVGAGRYVDVVDPEQAVIEFDPATRDARPEVRIVDEGKEATDRRLTVTLPAYGVAVLVRQ